MGDAQKEIGMKNLFVFLIGLMMCGSLYGLDHDSNAVEWPINDGGNGHFYEFLTTPSTWEEANSIGTILGGHLVTLNSQEETNFLNSFMNLDYVWMGLWQNTESPFYSEPGGGWEWITGESLKWTNWNPSEPNNSNGGENHGQTVNGGAWNDLLGDQNYPFIIEWDNDCNNDGFVDYGQIHDGSFLDWNDNNILDICETGACCISNNCDTNSGVICLESGGVFYAGTDCEIINCVVSTINVSQDGSQDFTSIQEAINASKPGDVILVYPGHYYENITFLGKSISVIGLFQSNTIIDGGGTSDTTVVFASGEDENAILQNFTIQGGNSPINGGGIYISGCSPTIRSCLIRNNQSQSLGGGMYCSGAGATIENCAFWDNSSSGDTSGGGIYVTGGQPNFNDCLILYGNTPNGIVAYSTQAIFNNVEVSSIDNHGVVINIGFTTWNSCTVSNCTNSGIMIMQSFTDQFFDCELNSNSSDNGGGMYVDSGSPTLTNCTFSSNTATDYGGGMYATQNSTPALYDCTFTNNDANNGGGLSTDESSYPSLIGCTFSYNSAYNGGGIYTDQSSTPNLTDCNIDNNNAHNGGGLANFGASSPVLSDSSLNNNTGYNGGGIYCGQESFPFLTFCSITNNNSTAMVENAGGGGIITTDSSYPTLENCTFDGNSSNWGGGMYTYLSSSPTLTYCIFTKNSASDGGGIRTSGDSDPSLTTCIFNYNTAYYNGGGMYNEESSSPMLTKCIFTNNTATYDGGGVLTVDISSPILTDCIIGGNVADRGAGVFTNDGSNPSFNNCTLTNNSSTSTGGGMCLAGGSMPEILGCAFDNNTAEGGGGISSIYSYPRVENCIFTNNSAEQGGGMSIGNEDGGTIINNLFESNTATLGGGLWCQTLYPVIELCEFVKNTADYGGGLWLGTGSLLGCQLRENVATNLGGGLYSDVEVSLQNCLICDNLPDWIAGQWIDNTGNDFPVFCPNDCVGDFDSDNYVNVIDLLGLIGDWGACEIGSPCPGDFNSDGSVDVTDLLVVIGNWGPCP